EDHRPQGGAAAGSGAGGRSRPDGGAAAGCGGGEKGPRRRGSWQAQPGAQARRRDGDPTEGNGEKNQPPAGKQEGSGTKDEREEDEREEDHQPAIAAQSFGQTPPRRDN